MQIFIAILLLLVAIVLFQSRKTITDAVLERIANALSVSAAIAAIIVLAFYTASLTQNAGPPPAASPAVHRTPSPVPLLPTDTATLAPETLTPTSPPSPTNTATLAAAPEETLFPQGTPISTRLLVDQYVATSVCAAEGERILITAEGSLDLGEFVGPANADGKDNFEFGGLSVPIDTKYYKYREYPLGMLMCKIDSQSDWMGCGASQVWDLEAAGCLEFDINDEILTDNSGGFTVTIETLR
jgi:hypothetical protein